MPLGRVPRLTVSDNRMWNFFDSVRSRSRSRAEIGRSVSVCHLGVIAMRLAQLQWDPAKEQFVGDADANRWLSREMRKPWTLDSV
jgi:hypothetical protein